MAKTLAGKALEKYLQSKVKDVFALEAIIAVGAYEGTLDMEDIEKLKKKLNNKVEDLDEMEKTLDSYKKIVDTAVVAVITQEGISLANPVTFPTTTALLVREKSKESADDLKIVVKEQGKSAIEMVVDGLKNAREALNKAGDDMKESLQQTRESLQSQSEEIT